MQLPKDSRNEQLEAISLTKLSPLFPEDQFILKREIIDNGVDIRAEIKKDGFKLGFGFLLQLKSSESIEKNKDGSISKSIEVSNIEYLVNNAQPAYYCFYDNKEKKFYYQSLYELLTSLNRKNLSWDKQESITVRFKEILDSEAIEKIYKETLQEGFNKRKQSQFLTDQSHHLDNDYKFIINQKGDTYSDIENILFIEQKGLYLNQSLNWKKVIELHEKISETSLKSPTYYLTVAIAYFNTGNFFKSRIQLREAEKNISEIAPILIPHLKFYKLQLNNIFGFIEKIDYEDILSSSDLDNSLKNHLKLESIVSLKNNMYSDDNFVANEFENKIKVYLEQPKLEKRFELMALLELTTYYADQFICLIPQLSRQNLYSTIDERFKIINQNFTRIQREQLDLANNESDIYVLALRHFKFLIHFNAIATYAFQIKHPDNYWLEIEKLVIQASTFFSDIKQFENQLFSLQTLLEFYQFIENSEKENNIREQLKRFKQEIDLPYFQGKIDFILNGGTFIENIRDDFKSYRKEMNEIKKMNEELKELDKKDSFAKRIENGMTIELFPIDHFFIPNEKLDLFFNEIIGISDEELISHIIWMKEEDIIPVLNIYVEDIKNEGRENGNLEYKGISSHKNLYRIRKCLYENEIKRVEIKFPEF
ncbi:DUF4365 domain-containing protein [Zunongwangia sp. F260]|uniref:DUF4365 domain-containing protein n=1 Tax=Autumnicola lenta TaxID=3075593 RepID=A0ABU3CQD8_9FLAO|nr:DUF4365 domain-containing protein [Zunongwangia sp. F260]MDT0648145.1 DUF4365 domain-containing protein [Zunongwangia sp. F260]